MGRRVNWELRRLVAQLYSAGLAAPEIAREVERRTGRRYSVSYIYKLVWMLKREGLIGGGPSSAWDSVADCAKAAKLRIVYALEELRSPAPRRRALVEALEGALRHLDDLIASLHMLRLAYDRSIARGVREGWAGARR